MLRVAVPVGVLVPGVGVKVEETALDPVTFQPPTTVVLFAASPVVAVGGAGVAVAVAVDTAVAVAGTSLGVAVALGAGGEVAVASEVARRGAKGCSSVPLGTAVAFASTVVVGGCDSEEVGVWLCAERRGAVAVGERGTGSVSCAKTEGTAIQKMASKPSTGQR